MAITTDIVRTWRGPRAVMQAMLAAGTREDRALAILMGACFLMFLAQLPLMARLAYLSATETGAAVLDRDQLFGTAFVAWMMIAPLGFYAVAWLTHLVLRVFGRTCSGYAVRLALFWSLLAATPLAILLGLVQGLIGPGPAANLVGAVWIAVFGFFWVQTTRATFQNAGVPA